MPGAHDPTGTLPVININCKSANHSLRQAIQICGLFCECAESTANFHLALLEFCALLNVRTGKDQPFEFELNVTEPDAFQEL